MSGSADGRVNISTDNGQTWQNISEGLPNRWITDVVFDPQDLNTIYATVSGFRWDEELAHVFKSTNSGDDWVAISGNLPEIPVNQLIIDPDDTDKLIVGTDAGIYMTVDAGDNWECISGNMPMVPIVAFKLIPATKDLYAATYGISTFKINLNDVNVGVQESETQLSSFDLNWKHSSQGNYITVKNQKMQSFHFKIYNSSGQLVQEKSLGSYAKGNHQIDIINDLQGNTAWLLVELIGDHETKTVKVIL
jgi:hypothetical protein